MAEKPMKYDRKNKIRSMKEKTNDLWLEKRMKYNCFRVKTNEV